MRLDAVSTFRHNGPVSPVTGSPMGRSSSSREDTLKRSPTSHGTTHRLASVQEHSALEGVGIHPADYIANTQSDDSYLSMTRTNLSPTDVYQSQKPSACPSMYSGSSAIDASPMTRHNSSFEGASNGYIASTPMINSASSHSMFADSSLWQDANMYDGKQEGGPDQDLLGCGATFPSQDCSPSAYNSSMLLPPNDSTSMERTGSNTSNSSARSNASNKERRLKERREQVLRNSQNQIRPKALETAPDKAAAASKKTKVAVSKTAYSRRKHPKVHCHICEDRPEFRGDHELQRHHNAKHSTSVTKFICRDPSSVGLHSDLQPKRPLKGCKSCDNGKLYGAYYNAAAHLRRWHFKPKTGRGKGRGSTEEKRGGSAGGHWPPMEDLKVWFEEQVIQRGQEPTQGMTETEEMEDDMADMEADDDQDQGPANVGTGSYSNVSPEFPITTTSIPQSMDHMVPDMLAPSQVASMTGMTDFMGFPSPTDMGAMPDSNSPMWGSASSNAFTPPGAFDFMGQGTMGSAFTGMD